MFLSSPRRGNTYEDERVMGIEPTSPAWKAGTLTIMLHPHTVPLGTAFVKLINLLLAQGLLAFTISCIYSLAMLKFIHTL